MSSFQRPARWGGWLVFAGLVLWRVLRVGENGSIPSYAVPGTPFMMASQCRRSASETGWRDWRTVEGSEVLSLSSWSRRLVDGGVGEREEGAIMGRRFNVMRLELKPNGQGIRWGMFTAALFSLGHSSDSYSGVRIRGLWPREMPLLRSVARAMGA